MFEFPEGEASLGVLIQGVSCGAELTGLEQVIGIEERDVGRARVGDAEIARDGSAATG